jgi:hypothetical protein
MQEINKQSVFLPFLCDKTIKTLHFVKGLFLVCLAHPKLPKMANWRA